MEPGAVFQNRKKRLWTALTGGCDVSLSGPFGKSVELLLGLRSAARESRRNAVVRETGRVRGALSRTTGDICTRGGGERLVSRRLSALFERERERESLERTCLLFAGSSSSSRERKRRAFWGCFEKDEALFSFDDDDDDDDDDDALCPFRDENFERSQDSAVRAPVLIYICLDLYLQARSCARWAARARPRLAGRAVVLVRETKSVESGRKRAAVSPSHSPPPPRKIDASWRVLSSCRRLSGAAQTDAAAASGAGVSSPLGFHTVHMGGGCWNTAGPVQRSLAGSRTARSAAGTA